MLNVITIQMTEEERDLLSKVFHVCYTLMVRISNSSVLADDYDLKVIKHVYSRREEVEALNKKIWKDKL